MCGFDEKLPTSRTFLRRFLGQIWYLVLYLEFYPGRELWSYESTTTSSVSPKCITMAALSSAITAPIFGTMERNGGNGPSMYESVKAALESGYRRFDLAERYTTGKEVGRAIAESKISRKDLFIISKIDGLPSGDYEAVKARVEAMLKDLPGVEQFDLLLIHHPLIQGADLNSDPGDLIGGAAWNYFLDNIAEAWSNMTRLQADGLAAAVGVSNFYLQHLEALDSATTKMMSLATKDDETATAATGSTTSGSSVDCSLDTISASTFAPVAAVEVYVDCAHPEEALVRHCQSRSPVPAAVLGYRPLAFMPVLGYLECEIPISATSEEGQEIGDVDATATTATTTTATTATTTSTAASTTTLLAVMESRAASIPSCGDARQLALAWLHARGVSPVVCSSDKGRISSNFNAAEVSATPSFIEAYLATKQGLGEALIPKAVSEQTEMISMMGGTDEYASAFAGMGL